MTDVSMDIVMPVKNVISFCFCTNIELNIQVVSTDFAAVFFVNLAEK